MSNHEISDLTTGPSVRSDRLDTDRGQGAAEGRVFDLDAAVTRLGGNRPLLVKIAEFFLGDSVQLMSDLQEAIEKGDVALAHRCVHSLKGLAANFDARTCQGAAQRIEDAAAAGNLDRVQSMLPQLDRELVRLNDALKIELLKSTEPSQ
jgi:HPt (histidine-containing phosphotransfer) domain-containing protein